MEAKSVSFLAEVLSKIPHIIFLNLRDRIRAPAFVAQINSRSRKYAVRLCAIAPVRFRLLPSQTKPDFPEMQFQLKIKFPEFSLLPTAGNPSSVGAFSYKNSGSRHRCRKPEFYTGLLITAGSSARSYPQKYHSPARPSAPPADSTNNARRGKRPHTVQKRRHPHISSRAERRWYSATTHNPAQRPATHRTANCPDR